MENKYTKDALEYGVGTADGFGFDIFEGGYIQPLEILIDQEKARKLTEAIKLLDAWRQELEDDGILNIY